MSDVAAERKSDQIERERMTVYEFGSIGADSMLSSDAVITWEVTDPTLSAVRARRMLWLEEAADDLWQLLQLKRGWDTYGAVPLSGEVAKAVIRILRRLEEDGAPRPALVPTPSGGVQLEWFGNGVELQLEVQPPARPVKMFYRQDDTGVWWEGLVGDAPEPLEKLLGRVSKSR